MDPSLFGHNLLQFLFPFNTCIELSPLHPSYYHVLCMVVGSAVTESFLPGLTYGDFRRKSGA